MHVSLSLHFFFPFPFLGTRIPIKFPIEFLMAFAATALMRGHMPVHSCVYFCLSAYSVWLREHFVWLCECTMVHRSSEPHSLKSAGSNGKWTAGGRAVGWREVWVAAVLAGWEWCFFYVGLAAGNRRWCWKQCYDGRTWRRGYGQWVSGRLDQWHCGCG